MGVGANDIENRNLSVPPKKNKSSFPSGRKSNKVHQHNEHQLLHANSRRHRLTPSLTKGTNSASSGTSSARISELIVGLSHTDCCQRGKSHINNKDDGLKARRGSVTSNQGSLASETSFLRIKDSGRCSEPKNYHHGRKWQMTQMIVLPFIPIVALIFQNVVSLYTVMSYQAEVSDIDRQVERTLSVGRFVTEIQRERSEVSFFVFTDTSYSGSNLTVRFRKTDIALENITEWPTLSLNDTAFFESKLKFKLRIENFRERISPNDSNISEVMEHYNHINRVMLNFLTREIKETNTSSVWRYLVSYKNLLRSVENIGISIVYGVNYYGRGHLASTNHIKYIRHDTLGTEYLNATLEFATEARRFYRQMTQGIANYGDIQHMRLAILANERQVPRLQMAERYYEAMDNYMEQLRDLQLKLRKTIRATVEARLRDADTQAFIALGILGLVLIVSPTIIFLVHKATSTIQMFSISLLRKAEELKKEKKKSDRLLFQMLPPSVAQELKQKRQVQAQYYDQVTIYFSDIVGFTEIAAECSPLEVVLFLSSIYKLFDARIERYDVYKVETIGDSYMVASGLPQKNGGLHVSEVATMALDLLAGSVLFQIPHKPGEKLMIRIGIHTGPVVAGVVGTKMPRYCLFGDTVNTASRMETTGEPLKVHISLEMKLALDAFGGFKTEHRGLIDVKGKGMMDTYWLCGKEGGIGRSIILECPGYFENNQPAFMNDVETEELSSSLPYTNVESIKTPRFKATRSHLI